MSWDAAPLGSVSQTFADGNWIESKDQSPDGIRLVQTGNVGEGRFKDRREKARFISPETFARLNCTEVLPGDLLVSRLPDPVGRSCLIPNTGDKMITAVDCTIVRPKGEKLDRNYLVYYTQSKAYQRDIEDRCTGTTRKRISRKNLGLIPIPLPPLEEQKRIVAVLDQAFAALDRARTNAEANLADAEELFTLTVESTFTDIGLLNSQAKLVSEIARKRRGSIRTGPFGSQLKHSEFVDEGIKVLGIDNAVQNRFVDGKSRYISEEKYEGLKRYRVFPGDVIITIMGTCGRCAIIPDDIPVAINTKHLCCISLDFDECLPEFLHRYFLLSPHAREYLSANAKGSVMDGLNMGLIKDLPVHLPNLLDQKRICKKLADLENKQIALIDQYRANLGDLEDLRQSLLQKAFAGELT